MPAADVPVGPDADSNVVLREVGKKPKFKFEPKQHFELGEALGLMDFETAAKLSGARFVVLKGPLARLERALAQFMLDLHTTEHGYTEINPPLLVRDDTMFGTGQLPKFKDDQYYGTSIQLDPSGRRRSEMRWRVEPLGIDSTNTDGEVIKAFEERISTSRSRALERIFASDANS